MLQIEHPNCVVMACNDTRTSGKGQRQFPHRMQGHDNINVNSTHTRNKILPLNGQTQEEQLDRLVGRSATLLKCRTNLVSVKEPCVSAGCRAGTGPGVVGLEALNERFFWVLLAQGSFKERALYPPQTHRV